MIHLRSLVICPSPSKIVPLTNKKFSKGLEAALWILKLKERRKLTQSAVDEILSDVFD